MTQFVQVGREVFNLAVIKNLRFFETESVVAVTLYLDPGVVVELKGDDARRFKCWWTEEANVYVCK